jgi:arsenite-transporting ATPase
MRLVLSTGKGGVGKTTVAAATALEAAGRGHRVLVVSTDPAHSLGDVLDLRIGSELTPVTARLDAVQLDGRHELERSWPLVTEYLRSVLGATDLDCVHADELLVVPGMDHLLALSRLRCLSQERQWDGIIVDCAPSADSLRLLALPGVLQWYMERLLSGGGLMTAFARRRLEHALDVRAPSEQVLRSVRDLVEELEALRHFLDDPGVSARLVLTPERVVLAEAERTLAYLALYGYATDAVIVNRVLGEEFDGPFASMRRAQQEVLTTAAEAFSSIPRFELQLHPSEPIGLDALEVVGRDLFAGVDPLDRLAPGRSIEFAHRGNAHVLRVTARGVDPAAVHVTRVDGELIVTLASERRRIALPDGLVGRPIAGASLKAETLEVVFGAHA